MKPTVFIGSSTEAYQRDIVPMLVQYLSDQFSVLPWYSNAVKAGTYTLEGLLDVTKTSDLALFVFTADDVRTSRGETREVTRDNVILEYGLFTAALGRKRVAIVHEEGVELPVDVKGLTCLRFARDLERAKADLARGVKELTAIWGGPLPPLPHRIEDGGLGFARALTSTHAGVSAAIEALWNFAHQKKGAVDPIDFDSRRACVTTYAEALDRVRTRFWTTSFISSGFWGGNNEEVIRANKHMLKRLAGSGQARRLFLVPQSLDKEAEAHKDQLVLDRKYGRVRACAERLQQFQQFKRSVAQLKKSGCDVRVVCDRSALHRELPESMKFDPADSELAIYDDWRVDVFGGGRTGRISGVACYTTATEHFESYLNTAERYFEQLWAESRDVDELIAKVSQAHEDAEARIDYESQWLAFYEYHLPPEDADLKTAEIARVGEILRARGKWGTLTRCLDIGTCTGRYPIFLRGGLHADGTVIGVDEDIDCLRFAAANVKQRCDGDPRIQIRKADFTSSEFELQGPFDLVTCMLGTPSHFGRGRDKGDAAEKTDLLQRTVERMAGLLAPNGLLILSTWSSLACADGKMLGIYKPDERVRLAEWTPPIAELRARLRRANLEIVDTAEPDPRLDITVCQPAARATTAVAA